VLVRSAGMPGQKEIFAPLVSAWGEARWLGLRAIPPVKRGPARQPIGGDVRMYQEGAGVPTPFAPQWPLNIRDGSDVYPKFTRGDSRAYTSASISELRH
jgi:hypothetical protein